MITKYEKANKGKLLVAVLALFVVLAGAAVVLSDNGVDAAATDKTTAFTTALGSETSYTVNGEETVTLTAPQSGSDKDFSITGSGTLTINFTASGTQNMFSGYDFTIDPTDGSTLTVTFNMTGSGEGCHILNDCDITVENGGKVVFTQVPNGISWYQGALVLDGNGELSISGGHGILGVTADLNGTSKITASDSEQINLNFTTINMEESTSIKATGSNVDMNINGASNTVAGEIDLADGDLYLASESSINADGGSISADKIKVIADGDTASATITKGKITGDFIPGTKNTGTTDEVEVTTTLNLSGTTFSGTSSISDKVTVNGTMDIENGAKVTVEKGAKISGTLTNSGTINVYGEISAATTNNGTVAVLDKDATIPSNMAGTGDVDMGAISSDIKVEGDFEKGTEYGPNQTVTITADSTIVEGADVIINGTLIINEGVTLTISKDASLTIQNSYGKMENNGTILVETADGLTISGATVENKGTIELAYSPASNEGMATSMTINNNATINNYGSIIISDDNKVSLHAVINNTAGGTLTISGQLYFGIVAAKLTNAGTIDIDGEVLANTGITATVSQVADTGVVNIASLTGKVAVTDSDLKYGKNVTFQNNANTITLSAGKDCDVGGISITSAVTSESSKYYRNMYISGSVDATYNGETETNVTTGTIDVEGSCVEIKDTLSLSDVMTLVNKGTLKVSGTLTVDKEAEITNTSATINVSGTIESGVEFDKNSNGTINAAKYVTGTTTKTYIYTTLENAVSSAAEAGVKTVDVIGNVIVNSNLTVPAGMTVKQASGTTITIGEKSGSEVTVTVAADAKIDMKGTGITVNGTLYIEDKKTGITRGASITSEVKAEGETDITYTNLRNAIAGAGSDPITITLNGNVKIDSNLTIPSNVTVDTNKNGFQVSGAILSIDGTLYLNGTEMGTDVSNYGISDDNTGVVDKKASVVLNGYIRSDSDISYNGKEFPAGAYYTVENGKYTYATSVANSVNVIADADDQTVNILGENKVGDLTYTGTADEPLTINVKGDLAAGSVTIDNASIVIEANKKVTITVSGASGEVALDYAYTNVETTFAVIADDEGVKALTVSGSIGNQTGEEANYAAVFGGDVTIGELTIANVTYTAMEEIIYSMTIDGTVTVVNSQNSLGNVLVNGTLISDNEVTINASTIAVLGTLTANAAVESENKGAGSVSTGSLFVGLEIGDLVSIGAQGTVNGDVSYNVMYVANGSTVPAEMIEDVKNTQFYIQDDLWMTAYVANGTVAINDVEASVDNARFIGWLKDDLKTKVTANDNIGNQGFEKVYANVDYKIYNVTVTVDGGIGSVAIDGEVMNKGTGNSFYLDNLTAGEHEITYQLKTGFEGTPTMTVNGTAASGFTFTLSGTEGLDEGVNGTNTKNVEISISLTGTTPIDYSQSGSSSDGGMGIVEILLVILVVVVVILAIIVVLRMMRS